MDEAEDASADDAPGLEFPYLKKKDMRSSAEIHRRNTLKYLKHTAGGIAIQKAMCRSTSISEGEEQKHL